MGNLKAAVEEAYRRHYRETRDTTEAWNRTLVEIGGAHLDGNRFEADVSPNRSRVDIKDRRNNRLFVLLGHEDLEELRELATELLRMVRE